MLCNWYTQQAINNTMERPLFHCYLIYKRLSVAHKMHYIEAFVLHKINQLFMVLET